MFWGEIINLRLLVYVIVIAYLNMMLFPVDCQTFAA